MFEHAGEEFNVRVLIVMGIPPKIVSEVSSLEGFGVLIDIDSLRIGNGRSLPFLSIIINFPEDGEHVDDVDDLLAVCFSLGLLLVDKSIDLPFIEACEYLADEGVLHQELSVLLVDQPLLLFILGCLHVLLLNFFLDLIPGHTESSSLRTQQLDHVLSDYDP